MTEIKEIKMKKNNEENIKNISKEFRKCPNCKKHSLRIDENSIKGYYPIFGKWETHSAEFDCIICGDRFLINFKKE